MRKLLTAIFALALPALAFVPVVQAAGDGGSAPAVRRDEKNQTGISSWMETILQGNAKYVSRDFPGAIESFRKAVQIAPKHPLGHYLLGEAQLATKNEAEADASWQAALRVADDRDPGLRGKILFVIADLKERQRKWEEAKAAWQAYSEFAAKYVDGGAAVFPASAAARIQAIDAAMKLDKDVEKVRTRIRDTADGGVFTLIDAGPG